MHSKRQYWTIAKVKTLYLTTNFDMGPGIWPRRLETVPCPCEDITKRVRKKHADKGKTAHIQTDDQVLAALIWQLIPGYKKDYRKFCWFGVQVIPRSPGLSDFMPAGSC